MRFINTASHIYFLSRNKFLNWKSVLMITVIIKNVKAFLARRARFFCPLSKYVLKSTGKAKPFLRRCS